MSTYPRLALTAAAVATLAACTTAGPTAPSSLASPSTISAAAATSSVVTGAPTIKLSGSGGGGGTGGGSGGGGGTVTPPATCTAEITSFSNTAGYGPYGPNVADIRTRVSVKNCTSSAVAWQARATYTGPFWGGTVFSFPLTCKMAIGSTSTATCQLTERYLLIQQTYLVTLDVLDANGQVLATASESVATPTDPNPAAT